MARGAADRPGRAVAPGVLGSRPGRRGRGRRGLRRRARLVVAAVGYGRSPAAPGQGGRRLSAAARAVLPVRPARRVHPGVLGPVTACGRDAIAVAATPRRGARIRFRRTVLRPRRGRRRRRAGHPAPPEETSGGQLLTLTELTDVTMNPPRGGRPGPVRAAAGQPPRRNPGRTGGNAQRSWLGRRGPGGGRPRRADQACAAPARSRRGPASSRRRCRRPTRPRSTAGDGSPPRRSADLLYRSGEPRDLGATVRRVARPGRDHGADGCRTFRAAGRGGFGDLIDAMTRRNDRGPHGRPAARQRPGPVPPRLLCAAPTGAASTTIACDGERRWRVFPDRTLVGPAAPLRTDSRILVDSCWLLRCRLSGGAGHHLPRPPRPPAPGDPRPRRRGYLAGPLTYPTPPTRSWTPRPAACSA